MARIKTTERVEGANAMKRSASTDPDTLFTPTTLSRHLRELSGGRSTIGPNTIRRMIRGGDLKASQVGNRKMITWENFLESLKSLRVQPEPPAPDAVRARVAARIAREDRVGA